MPKLQELMEKRKFTKRNYRPWDLTGEGKRTENKNSAADPLNTISDEKQHYTQSQPPQIKNATEDSKKETNLDQKKATIKESLDNNKVTTKEQLDNTKGTQREQLGNNKITIREQLDNILSPNSTRNIILNMTGIQANLFTAIANICLSKNQNETGPTDSRSLASHIGTTHGSLKTSINRLIKKGVLVRKPGKRASGGYINLKIPEDVIDCLLYLRSENHPNQFVSSLLTANNLKLDNKKGNDLAYSSSNINTTTNGALAEKWKSINFSQLTHIGFSVTQLKQLQDYNDPDVVQESIYHFAFGLENNPKVKEYTQPLNVIMGVLRKGQGWVESKYQSPTEIAQEKFLEVKKLEKKKMDDLYENAFQCAFDFWMRELSVAQVEQIVPPKKGMADIIPKDVKLKQYFKKNIWPTKKSEYIVS